MELITLMCKYISQSIRWCFSRKENIKKRYKDAENVRLIPLCKMRLYPRFVRRGDVLSYELRLQPSLVEP